MKERFTDKEFKDHQMEMIRWADAKLIEYQRGGYTVTLRQLFYAAVSVNLLDNTQAEYGKLGDLIADARMAGWLDWDAIVDRGRFTRQTETWKNNHEIMKDIIETFKINKWESQPNHVEVMIEKQALEGVVAPICQKLEVPFTANKGYVSATVAYDTGKRLQERRRAGKTCYVVYGGDHDPSGLDMGRDLKERLELFSDGTVHIIRVALNRDQVEKYHLPRNPAKSKDPRFPQYQAIHGDHSWEMDALPIEVLSNLFTDAVTKLRDNALWDRDLEIQESMRDQLQEVAEEVMPDPNAPPKKNLQPDVMLSNHLPLNQMNDSSSSSEPTLRKLEEVSDENVVRKLTGLLVMAHNSSDEGEASNALEAAKRLAIKHSIDMASVELGSLGHTRGQVGLSSEPFVSVDHKTAEGDCRRPPCHKFISWVLCAHFKVEILTNRSRWSASTISVVGRKSDVAFAIYAYDFLVRTFNSLWRKYKQETGAYQDQRNSYFYGLYIRLDNNLKKATAETVTEALKQFGEESAAAQKWDLMVVQEKDLLRQALKDNHPTLKYVKIDLGNVDSDHVISDGIRDGDQINIARPLDERGSANKTGGALS